MTPSAPLPHSTEAERAVLATVLLTPQVLDDLDLESADFYLERHRLLFDACRGLAAEQAPIDLRTVQARLEQQNNLERVGGLAYLAALDLDLPDISRVESYAAIVRDRTTRRHLMELAQRLQQRVRGSELGAGELTAGLYRELEALEDGSAGKATRYAPELLPSVLADLAARHEVRRRTGQPVLGLKTGIPRLDELLCGLSQGLHLLAGPPGVGKTSLALQMALQVARETPVIYVSYENRAQNLLLKALCARANVDSRDALRGFADLEALERAGEELRPELSRVLLLDGDNRLTTSQLRSLARRAMEQHSSKQCLLVVDYLQLMAKMSQEFRGLADTRSKVDTLGGELIALSKRLDSPILALSSQSRSGGNYGHGGGQAKLDSLKESGDLEYSADVAMFLTEDQDGGVTPPARSLELTVKKQRNGPTDTIPLVYLPDRGVLRQETFESEGY